MKNNPFRSNKWRHTSTTTELKDTTTVIGPPSPPDSTTTNNNTKTNKKKNKQGHNSDNLLEGIGDYIFQSSLGGGKFSKVILSYHYLTGLKVAIKMINKKEHPYRVMSRLVREISIMEVLNHENVVKLYETYETADTLYIVMEYVPGYNLEEYLKSIDKSAIPEHQARDIFRQVVKAVDHCHSKWIVHRDLKTPNILLTPDHHVKIADFGLGNRFGLQRLRTICGSLLYYSPEIMTSRSYIGPEVDSWCLGIMLYRMTAGLELFAHAKTQPELRKLVISHRYKFPTSLSPELIDTIKKCLAVDKFDRLSLKSFLSNDAWFNDFGKLQDIFEEREDSLYHAKEITEAYAQSIREEDNIKIQTCSQHSKKLHLQDLKEEKKRGYKVPKTVIYHITNASTYFTGKAPHHSKQPIDLDAQKVAKAELHETILMTLKQLRLQQLNHVADLGINHLFQKFKRTDQERKLRKANSALNIYQRITKDHITYYSIQYNISTDSSTTFISNQSTINDSILFKHSLPQQQQQKKRLSKRLSMIFFPNNNNNTEEYEQNNRNQIEMIKIIRLVCNILGISYYQSSPTQLICLLTLKNSKKHIIPQQQQQQQKRHSLFKSKIFTSNDKLSTTQSFISSNYSNHSQGWFSRQVHRLSGQFSTMDNTTQLLNISYNGYDLLNIGRIEQEQQIDQKLEEEEEEDGFASLSIELSPIQSNKYDEDGFPLQIISIRYSKLKGSTKVFKLAKGWIQTILSQNQSRNTISINKVNDYNVDLNSNDIIRL